MSASDERSESDAEWAAGVMGRPFTCGLMEIQLIREDESLPREWDPAHDANDFRDLLNCEAVREFYERHQGEASLDCRQSLFGCALSAQPDALKFLREAMEGPSGRE